MIIALGCIYGIAMLLFTIAFLTDWFKLRKQIRPYLKYGVWFGAIVIGLDLFIVAITPSSWNSNLLIGLVAEPIVLIRVIGFTMLGMYYSATIGYPSFPILLRKFKVKHAENSISTNTTDNSTHISTEENGNLKQTEISSDFPAQAESIHQTESLPLSDVLLEIKWTDYFIKVFGVSIIGILYSVALFLLTTPHLSEAVQQKFAVSSITPQNAATFQNILLVLEIAIAEEIIFRLGIQSLLAKYLQSQNKGYWLAILITSVLWTLGHAGTLEPEWVKLVQIFPMGLMLGWLFKKYGIESTILVHGLFNVVLVFLSAYLIK